MSFRPNFTGVSRSGDSVVVTGRSDEPTGDILAIHVVLSQDGTIARGVVDPIGPGWRVELPAAGFDAGAVTAFGVEAHADNATTVTWAQTLQL
jgi:hypothetical protein